MIRFALNGSRQQLPLSPVNTSNIPSHWTSSSEIKSFTIFTTCKIVVFITDHFPVMDTHKATTKWKDQTSEFHLFKRNIYATKLIFDFFFVDFYLFLVCLTFVALPFGNWEMENNMRNDRLGAKEKWMRKQATNMSHHLMGHKVSGNIVSKKKK